MIARPTLDLEAIRADFPILKRSVNGHPLVYFDNAATTQKPQAVIDALSNYYQSTNANIHRGLHTLAEEATAAYEGVRHKVGALINAPDPRSVIFTRNTTESLNLLAYSWTQRLQPGDEILLTMMEHHSNLVPWQLLAQRSGARLVFLDVNEAGELDLAQAKERIGPRTKVVAVVQMSNVLGTINPIADLAQLAHRGRSRVHRRRRAECAPPASRRAGLRHRLPRLLVAQDARPNRRRRALRPTRAVGGNGAVPQRRRDDQRRDARELDLGRAAPQNSRRAPPTLRT